MSIRIARSAMQLKWGTALLGGALIFAPLIRGGNRPLAGLVLELTALALIAGLALHPRSLAQVPRDLGWVILALVLWPALQLLPIPFEWWAMLPGRGDAAFALGSVGVSPQWMSVALVPGEAERAVWALLPPIALFLAVASLDAAQVRRLVFVFLGVAAFQAVLGLIQYGGGPDSMLRFGYLPYGDSAIGSYANRSHLAGLLGMALPIAMGLLAACIFGLHRGARVRRRGGLQGWLNRLASGGSKTNQMAVWSVLCLVLLLGIVFARSRTGIAVAMVGLVVTAVVLVRNFGGKFAAGMTGAVVGLGLTLAVTVGLAPVFARFGLDATQDLRWPMLETTLEAAWRFFPIGSGPGSFVEVFRSVHPQAIGGEAYVNHAHNDYAEWWLEGGVPAVLLILAFIVLYVRRWRGVWAVRGWDSFHMMQVGAGVGLLMLALFGLTDYNLRIPANQIYFALLAAVFFHPGRPGGKEAGVRGPMRKVYASVAEAGGMAVTRPKDGSAAIDPWVEAPASPGVQPTAPPSSPLKGSNPFME